MDLSLDDNAFDWSSETSTSASEFEDVVEHKTTIGVADAIEDYETGRYRSGVPVGFDATIDDDFLPPYQG